MPITEEQELDESVNKILESKSLKKLVVAGPGAGKTTLFQKLLDRTPGHQKNRLVLTFINNLKEDIKRSLGDKATVNTLHGYCQLLLRQSPKLRGHLTENFVCYPGLASIIKQDWKWLYGSPAQKFVDHMRNLGCSKEEEIFYFGRANYYDAVDFDDSVYRVYRQLKNNPTLIPSYKLVLIDEFQDFNKMEAEIVNLLGGSSPMIIAGDDDQALYSRLRGASWEHIRAHHAGSEYEVFTLPFCMRCPEVIVGAVNDVIARAQTQGKLVGRIDKPFRYFPPAKEEDSKLNPQINFVHTSVQSTRANYFGRYVAQTVGQIPESDFEKATSKNESCVLVIGSRPYLPQIRAHLVEAGLLAEDVLVARDERKEGLVLLKMNPKSNLGWRILLGHDDPVEARVCIQKSVEEKVSLVDVISEEFKKRILAEIYQQNDEETKEEETEVKVPRILLTSYEGAKGLSAQHVILAGLHNGELPRRLANIDDIEICKFLVGLTRTRKKCTIISTKRFGMVYKNRSVFVDWINQNRIFGISVDAAYWQIST